LSYHRRLLRNAGSSLTATAVNLVIGLFLMPFTIRHLGVSAFGVLTLVNTRAGYAGLLDLGLSPAIVRATAQHLASSDPDERAALARTLSTAFYLYVLIGLVAAAVIFVGGIAGGLRFTMTAQELRQFRLVLGIVCVQTMLSFSFSTWNGVVGGLQDFHVLNWIGIAGNVARAVVTVVLLRRGFGLVSLVAAGLVLAVAGWSGAFWWSRRRIPDLRIRWASADREHGKSLWGVSGVMVVWSLAGYALHQMDRVVVAFVAPVAAVGVYEIGARLVGFSRNVVDSWLATVLPAATRAHARGAQEELGTIYRSTTRYVMMTYGVFVAPALLIGPEFLTLWIGPGLRLSSAVLTSLVIATAYQSHNVVAHVMLPGVGRLQFFGRFMAVYAVLVVTGQVLGGLARGPVGVAEGTAAAVVVIESWLTPRIWRFFGVSPRDAVVRIFLPSIVPVLVSAVALASIKWFMPISSWPVLIAATGVGVVLYVMTAWQVGLTRDERAIVQRNVTTLLALHPVVQTSPS
jgi:O-antigen/teichoic acid export membrane protein